MNPRTLVLPLLGLVLLGGTLHAPAAAPEAEPVHHLDGGEALDPGGCQRACLDRVLAAQRTDEAAGPPWMFPSWGLPVLVLALVGKLWAVGPGLLSLPLVRPLRWLLFVPLYSRISNAALFENPVRKRISAYVQEHPGATIMEVRNAVGIAWGTAVYHLERLERSGELVGERRGNHHRYFQANTPEARHRAGWSALQQPNAYSLARAIADNPGIHQKGLCEGLGLNNPAASKHLRKLRDAGLVQAQRISRYVVYEPTDRLHSTLELMAAQGEGQAGTAPDRAGTDGPTQPTDPTRALERDADAA